RPEPRTPNLMSSALGGGKHDLYHIDGDGEADPNRASGLRKDRGIDAHEPCMKIDESAARIARIDRRVCLNEKAVIGDPGLRTRQGRDNTLRHRLSYREGVADGENDVADLKRIGIPQFHHRKVLATLQWQVDEVGPLITQHAL